MRELVRLPKRLRDRQLYGRFRVKCVDVSRRKVFAGEKVILGGVVQNDNSVGGTVYVVAKIIYAHAPRQQAVFDTDRDLLDNDRFALRLHQIFPGAERDFTAAIHLSASLQPGIYDLRVELWNPARLDRIDGWITFPHMHSAYDWNGCFAVIPSIDPTRSRPRVFVSYAWIPDKPKHAAWVTEFADELKKHDLDCLVDRHNLAPGDDMARFMNELTQCDFFIPICSDEYTERANLSATGGVAEETRRARTMFEYAHDRFIPVLRDNSRRQLPEYMKALWWADMDSERWRGLPLREIVEKIRQRWLEQRT